MMRIPAIDLLDGRVVRLRQGDFACRSDYSADPLVLAHAYREAGAEQLHVVDLNAARGDAKTNRALVDKLVSESGLLVQAGGGLREETQLATLLGAGLKAVVVGSLCVREPTRVIQWLKRFGGERMVFALDVRLDEQGTPRAQTDGWRVDSGISLWDLLGEFVAAGLQHLLCTDVQRDGMLSGPNIELYREILARFPDLRLQASGGVGSMSDIESLVALRVPAVILGKSLLERRIPLSALRSA